MRAGQTMMAAKEMLWRSLVVSVCEGAWGVAVAISAEFEMMLLQLKIVYLLSEKHLGLKIKRMRRFLLGRVVLIEVP